MFGDHQAVHFWGSKNECDSERECIWGLIRVQVPLRSFNRICNFKYACERIMCLIEWTCWIAAGWFFFSSVLCTPYEFVARPCTTLKTTNYWIRFIFNRLCQLYGCSFACKVQICDTDIPVDHYYRSLGRWDQCAHRVPNGWNKNKQTNRKGARVSRVYAVRL